MCCPIVAHLGLHGIIEEVGITDAGVHEADVGRQAEGGIGVAQPVGYLLDIAAGLKQQRGAGVAERVMVDPGQAGCLAAGSSTPRARFGGGRATPVGDGNTGALGPR